LGCNLGFALGNLEIITWHTPIYRGFALSRAPQGLESILSQNQNQITRILAQIRGKDLVVMVHFMGLNQRDRSLSRVTLSGWDRVRSDGCGGLCWANWATCGKWGRGPVKRKRGGGLCRLQRIGPKAL
jgi:hypothetical protein